ncbi:hypothetical protein ACIBEA_02765 [Streptomyces sp. NPDC051555]|uniref:hypothetical protein n=1 Tax=Streptomyces sp. NPDC051555 TaxID=3365657 RepID=UPI003788D49B
MSARAEPVPARAPEPVSVPAPAKALAPAPAPVPTTGSAPVPATVGGALVEELALQGGAELTATPAIAAHLDALGAAGGPVPVRLGQLATGTLNLRRTEGGALVTGPGDAFQPVPLLHPLLHPLRARGIEPVLALRVHDGVLEGHASAVVKGRLLGGGRALLDLMEQHPDALGWAGLGGLRLPGVENELRGTTLVVNVSGMSFTLGGFLSATGGFGLANEVVTFDAVARGAVAGLGAVAVPVRRGPDGALTGSASVDVLLRGFTGQLTAAFGAGAVDVRGTVRYTNEKFDGELTLVATDAKTAKELTDSKLPDRAKAAAAPLAAGAAPEPAAPSAAPVPVAAAEPVAAPGPRVVAGWGTLQVRLADWLSGEALVIVDHLGDVTVAGKIAPRMDKPLFAERRYEKQLARFEVRAAYGVPLVGNVFLFANIGLEALAVLGPATLDHIELTGTWSTKPEVLRDFGLTATLKVSASAGLKLTAEGGAGATLVGHDIKAGLALSALAGIRGYVEATPRIGYREVADPKAGKHGEFFLAGHMELAAQPFLGLGGALFVELDSPWWSPVPDHRWDWPLFQREYPLPGEFGIGADVEHVVGSGKVPEVTFGEVDFAPEKFLSDLVGDRLPAKTAKDEPKRGSWSDPGTAAPPATPKKSAATPPPAGTKPGPATPAGTKPGGTKPSGAKAAGTKPAGAKAGADEPVVPAPAVQERWLTGLKALGEVAAKSHRDPYDAVELRDALAGIKKAHGFTALEAELHGNAWQITASMNPTTHNVPLVEADTTAKPAAEVPVPDDEEAHVHLLALNRRMEAVGAGKVGQGTTPVERAILRDAYPDVATAQVTRGMVMVHIRELVARKDNGAKLDIIDAARAKKREQDGRSIYDTLKDTNVPAAHRTVTYQRAGGKDEYGENPVPRGSWSVDHVVAKKEFAEIPDVARLHHKERLELVHHEGNLRMQEKSPNYSRQEVPWPQWAGARKWYRPERINEAIKWYHEAKALLLGQIAKILAKRRG